MISSDEIPNLDDPEKLDPMSWAGQLSYLSVEVARTHVLNVHRAEAEARYRAKLLIEDRIWFISFYDGFVYIGEQVRTLAVLQEAK
jgi:hypothetical protein